MAGIGEYETPYDKEEMTIIESKIIEILKMHYKAVIYLKDALKPLMEAF